MQTTPKMSGNLPEQRQAGRRAFGSANVPPHAGRFAFVLLACLVLAALPASAQVVEWGSMNGGGNSVSAGGNILNSSINQLATAKSTDATPYEWWMGYQQWVPTPPDVSCDNPSGTGCDTSCYGTSNLNETFTFTSDTSFDVGATQYYRYLWQTNNTYTAINSGSKWSSSGTLCGGTCTKTGTSMTIDATSSSNTWYLMVRSFSGGQSDDDGWIGTTADGTGVQILGPYKVDITGPAITGTVTPASTEYNSEFVDSPFNMSISGISDAGCANTSITCQYCESEDGSCDTEWAAATYNSGTCSINDVTCTDGVTNVTLNFRAYDANSNVTTASSITRKCDDTGPAVSGIDADNTDYSNTYVDGTFDLSGALAETDAADSGVASCQYCKSTDGTCDTEWAAGGACTGASCTCSNTGLTCTDGQSLTLNIRGTDNVGNVGTGTAISRTCDTVGPVVGTVTPDDVDYGGAYVDSPFSLSATVTDARSGVDTSTCEYCKSTDGTCDTEWTSTGISYSGGSCVVGETITCTNGQSLTLNIRATDNVGNVGTGTAVTRTCDTAGPVVGAVTPDDTNYSTTHVDSPFSLSATASDVGSGIDTTSCQYCLATDGTCDTEWTSTGISYTGGSCVVGETITCTDGNSLTLNIRVSDNLGQQTTGTAVTRYCDDTGPDVVAGSIDADNTDYSDTYVDGTFDLSGDLEETDTQDSGVASCEYCKATDGTCDTEWAAGSSCTGSSCTCSVTGITCTDGQSLTLNIRGTDNVENVGTGTAISRTCDTVGPVVGTVTPDDVDYSGSYVDSPFSLSATVTDARSGVDTSTCEYCKATDGTCDTEWTSTGISYSGGSCVVGETITCTNGQSLTLNIRVTDNVGNLGTGTAVTRTCDTAGPVVGTVTPDDTNYSTTHVDSPFSLSATASDVGAGVDTSSCQYCLATDGTCDTEWTSTGISYSGGSCVVGETITCTDGNSLTLNIRVSDNLGQQTTGTAVTRYCDDAAPTVTQVQPTSDETVTSTAVTRGQTTCGDGSAADDSGLHDTAQYDVQYCNDGTSKGNCTSAGTWTDGTPSGYSSTNTDSFTGTRGNYYRFRGRCRDNVLNESAWTYSTGYVFVSSGGYLVVSENENPNNTNDGYYSTTSLVQKVDGVLNPNGSDYEEIQITLYDENDNQLSLTKSVTVTITNPGSSGAYISDANFTSMVPTPGSGVTSITGSMTSGQGYVRIKATAEQDDALIITATAADLSGQGGRNQAAHVVLRTSTGPAGTNVGIETVETGFSPLANSTVMNPVWSPTGQYVAFPAKMSGQSTWNIYVLEYNGSSWSSPFGGDGRVTSDDMCVQPTSGITFTGDTDSYPYILFTGKTPCQTSGGSISMDMYAVDLWGSNAYDDLNTLEGMGLKISDSPQTGDPDYTRWYDASWGEAGMWDCSGSSFANSLLVTLMEAPPNASDLELYMLSGSTNGFGLYQQSVSTITQITDIDARSSWSMMGSWSHDCDKLVFMVFTGLGGQGSTPYTGIYMIDLTAATLPVTSLTDTGVTKIQECDYNSGSPVCPNGAALFPHFSADDTMVSYMVDQGQSFDMYDFIIQGATLGGDLAGQFFDGANFDNFLEYILDQPTFAPQLIGQSSNNEFGLVQCNGFMCPLSGSGMGNIFAYITQKTGTRDGALSFLELDSMSVITSAGGLLFYQGAVTAVIPPGAIIENEVKLQVTDPGSAPGSTDGKDILVEIGEARDFFPDGAVFDQDIRLVFQYCDSDNNGYLDTVQDANCTGSGGTIDENSIYVYYYCEVGNSVGCTDGDWIQLDGTVDPVNNTITVVTNHFSEYAPWALVRGRIAPQSFTQTHLDGILTFPNPWRSGQGNITFFAGSTSQYNANPNIDVSIQIYDLRGSLVKNIYTSHNTTVPASLENGVAGGLELATWDVTNSAGRPVASGIYLYRLSFFDGVFEVTHEGKLAVVR